MIDGRIIQGSTPILSFDLPIAQDLVKEIRISFSQKNKLILVKELKDCQILKNTIYDENKPGQDFYTLKVQLTQEDTFLFKENLGPVSIRLRILSTSDGVAVAEEIIMEIKEIADKAVMGDVQDSNQI